MNKIGLDIKKGMEAVTGVVHKTSELGKAVAIGVQSGVKEFTDQTKQENYERRLKRYNPVFPSVYRSQDFNVPNLIKIVDDAERRGIDVCKGAIGWLEKKNDVEILCLYDEAVDMSGLQFVPAAVCDSIYYVDSYDRTRFVRLDRLFDKAHEEKIAELHHVAYCLGAKSCYVEIEASDVETYVNKRKTAAKANISVNGLPAKVDITANTSAEQHAHTQRSGKGWAFWAGTQEIKRPELRWFRYDESVQNLIDMRCEGGNPIKSLTLALDGAASATMSQKTAAAIDGAVGKLGSKCDFGMEMQVVKESRSKFLVQIEF